MNERDTIESGFGCRHLSRRRRRQDRRHASLASRFVCRCSGAGWRPLSAGWWRDRLILQATGYRPAGAC